MLVLRSTPTHGVVQLTLNRPERRNALTPKMLDELLASINAVTTGADTSAAPRVLLLAGAGASFCAGFDLALMRDDDDALRAMLRSLSACVRALRRLPIPVVVGAHGAAVAGGCALLSGADVVVTDRNAKLGYPVLRLGVSPAVNAPGLLPMLGPGGARARFLDTALIHGSEAVRVGLAHECVDDATLVLPRAIELAVALAAKPSHALAATKALLNELDSASLDDIGRDDAFERGLNVSLGLVGGDESRALLRAANS
jgi:methylglutaconyl-CoA hydratase